MSGKLPRATGLNESVRRRLLNLAQSRNEDYNFVLSHYAIERLLYRLSKSKHRDRFLLKGAMLLRLWVAEIHRPTRDLDLLGSGAMDEASVREIFTELCDAVTTDDAVTFESQTIAVEQVRDDREYHGLRVRLLASVGGAQVPIQIDIGVGDAVTPEPGEAEYPTMLDFPAPHLRIYPRETVVAEKFQAVVMLGVVNSRIKDFYDLWVLARTFPFNGDILSSAIAATFERRQTPLPSKPPVGLTKDFWLEGDKWGAFLNRNKLGATTDKIDGVLDLLRRFLLPPTSAAIAKMLFTLNWSAGGDWS